MTTTAKTQASEFGKQAFLNGKKRVPAHDKNVMGMLVGLQIGESTPIFKAWLAGYDNANLSQVI